MARNLAKIRLAHQLMSCSLSMSRWIFSPVASLEMYQTFSSSILESDFFLKYAPWLTFSMIIFWFSSLLLQIYSSSTDLTLREGSNSSDRDKSLLSIISHWMRLVTPSYVCYRDFFPFLNIERQHDPVVSCQANSTRKPLRRRWWPFCPDALRNGCLLSVVCQLGFSHVTSGCLALKHGIWLFLLS